MSAILVGIFRVRPAHAIMHHKEDYEQGNIDPESWEYLSEVVDPEGATIAYFRENELAQSFCELLNVQGTKMGLITGGK